LVEDCSEGAAPGTPYHLKTDFASVAGKVEWPSSLKVKQQEENDLCLLVVNCCDLVSYLEIWQLICHPCPGLMRE
jgi:hypothetical protein